MRKIIQRNNLDWEEDEMMRRLLNLSRLPELIIIETVEDEYES